jgi:hypothetical protein
MEGFEVRPAEDADAEGVSTLVSGMPNSAHIQDLFRTALGRGTAVVAAVQVQCVCMCFCTRRLLTHFYPLWYGCAHCLP